MGHKKTIIDFKGLQRRLIFTNPIQELIAETISDVKSVLAQVEKYQKKGYFVVGYLSYEASKAFESRYQVKKHRLLTEKLAYFTVHDSYQESMFPLSYDTVEAGSVYADLIMAKGVADLPQPPNRDYLSSKNS